MAPFLFPTGNRCAVLARGEPRRIYIVGGPFMKRKLLSVLLTLCLAFSLLPTAALADGEGTQTNDVAQIGETKYATLQEAVNAANDNTVKLLENVTEDINIPTGINVTLDLNGHKITNVSGHTITVEKGGKLNISDSVGTGVVDNTSHGKGAIVNSGEVTLNGGTFKRSAENGTSPYGNGGNSWYTIANYGTMEINTGVTVENAGGYSSMIRNGGEATADCNLTIRGGNFTGGINTVKNDLFGVLTINGGNFSNTAQYVIMNWNKAEITAGTFQTLDTASAVLFTSAFGSNANYVGELTISGGEFKHASDTQEMIVDHYDESNKGNAVVTGGKFDADISTYVPDGYIYNGETNTVEQLTVNNAVAKIEDIPYKTLAAAISAAGDGNTVTLLKDVTEKVSISRNLVLDLNGKTLTGKDLVNSNRKNERIALTANAGEVKVKNGIIDGRVNAYDSANLTIDADVTVKNSYNGSGYDCFGIVVWGDGIFGQDGCKTPKLTVNGKVIMEKGGVAISTNGNDKSCAIVTINNGAVISTTEDGAIYLPSGKLTMNGGTVSGPTGIQICAGSTNITSEFKLHNGTVIATGADERTSKGTGDGLIPDGAAISVVNRNYPNGVPSVTIDGGSFSSANSDAVLAYSWSNGAASEWTDAKTYVKINDGYFSSDPSAYVADGHYVDASNNGDYPYTVKVGTKTDAPIIVKDATDVTVPTDAGLTDADKNAIKAKSNVDGVAEAIADNKAALIPADVDITGAKKVEIEVSVKVEVKSADLSGENAAKTLTFEAKPVATITVTKSDNTTVTKNNVPVPNSLLSGEITVKLPLPAGFTPEQIKHISSDRSVEYFLKTEKRGAKLFTVDSDNCAVFTITKFSTFELSGTVTYVEPSYSSGSSYDPTYSVTVDKTKNGSVTVSPKNASKGDTVTVTVKPDSGYVLETLTVTDKNGNELTLKDKGNGKYTFTMPAGKVEVKATFMEDNSMLNFFYDVPNNAYFYEAVKWAVKNGITTGVGNDLFAPEQPCTRAQIVTFLWRAAGSPEPKGAASGMTDVVSGSYYEKAVAWAIENGITTGTTTSTFSPDATCTRAQAVTFLARALKAKAASAAEFSDVPTGSYFADAVAWAAANGVTEGIGGGLFGSDNDCTRGQIVTFLYRAYNK